MCQTFGMTQTAARTEAADGPIWSPRSAGATIRAVFLAGPRARSAAETV